MKNAHSFRSYWAETFYSRCVLPLKLVVTQKSMSELWRINIDERQGHSEVQKKRKVSAGIGAEKQAAPTPVFSLKCPH